MSSDIVKLDAPLFVTWTQCIVSVVICLLLRAVKKSNLPLESDASSTNMIKTVDEHSISEFKQLLILVLIQFQVLPVAILFTSMVATNNLCLRYVPVSFYYIGRSLTTVFNVIFSYALLRQTSSFQCIICCAMIVAGFWLGVDQESVAGMYDIINAFQNLLSIWFVTIFLDSFSLIGTIFGVLGSISLSLYSIYMKKTLPIFHDKVLVLNYFLNVYATILFIPLMIFNGEISRVISYEHLFAPWFLLALLVGGVCGFSIGYVTGLQIKVTSPLTHNISGTAKACAQTVIATQWNQEQRAPLWWVSNFVVLFGSSLYARVKQLEMDKKYKQSSIQSEKAWTAVAFKLINSLFDNSVY